MTWCDRICNIASTRICVVLVDLSGHCKLTAFAFLTLPALIQLTIFCLTKEIFSVFHQIWAEITFILPTMMSARKTLYLSFVCYFWRAELLLLFEQYSVQVWVGVDIHWLPNDSVICVMGLSTAEPRKTAVAGNCCGGRLGFVLGWAACYCPLLPLSLTLTLLPCLLCFIP